MTFNIGLQDVMYDSDLLTGEVDFDFFDGNGSPSSVTSSLINSGVVDRIGNVAHDSESACIAEISSTVECSKSEPQTGATNAVGCHTDVNSLNHEECNDGRISGGESTLRLRPIGIRDWRRYITKNSQCVIGPTATTTTGAESECRHGEDSGERKEPAGTGGCHGGPDSAVDSESTASGSACTCDTDGPPDAERDVAAIRHDLQRMLVTSNRTRQRRARLRRPRPQPGCAHRKRWSSNLNEAAQTTRQLAQLTRVASDVESSSSDMVGESESDSDPPPVHLQTWLGRESAERTEPAGRPGLLQQAVRHLERNSPQTMSVRDPTPPPPSRLVRLPHRNNMSFTNEQVRQIDRENRILLKKIVAQHRRPAPRHVPMASGGAPCRTQQDDVRRDNLVLLRKIRTARPSRSVLSGFCDEPPAVRPILERGAMRHSRPWVDR